MAMSKSKVLTSASRIENRILVIRGQKVMIDADLAKLKFSRTLPYAFTEHGAIQASNVLASPQAVELGVYVVRVFERLREVLSSTRELAAQLDALEQKTERLSMQHDTLAGNTRAQLKQVFDALRQLMTPPDPPRRPIGFVTEEKSNTSKGARARK